MIERVRAAESFASPTYACRPPGAHHGPFKSEQGCMLFEIHYYDESRNSAGMTRPVKLAILGPDLELLFSGGRRRQTGIFPARRNRRVGRADFSRRQVLRGVARWQHRFGRRFGTFGARRFSRMARGQTALCTGPGHVLVPGHALALSAAAWRSGLRQGQKYRRRTMG